MRRMTQLGFAAEDNGVYRFLPPIHRFLDVCLSVQQDRDLAASQHAKDLAFVAPVLIEEDEEPIVSLEEFAEPAVQPAADVLEAESEEDAIARAIAEEQADMEAQA
jgi:hypothetical protein